MSPTAVDDVELLYCVNTALVSVNTALVSVGWREDTFAINLFCGDSEHTRRREVGRVWGQVREEYLEIDVSLDVGRLR